MLTCQITTFEGRWSKDDLPQSWKSQLDAIAEIYPRAIKPRCVGYEIPKTEDGHDVRWARFDAFIVNRGW